MNLFRPVVAVYTAAFVTTIILNGCGDKPKENTSNPTQNPIVEKVVQQAKTSQPLSESQVAKETPTQQHLSTFLALHTQFCEKKYKTSELLKKELEQSPKLSLAKNFDGVYELLVGNISFAVSPEEDGCTTDVMVQNDGIQIFTFEDINTALLEHGYTEMGQSASRKDRGTDQTELTVIEKKYLSPSGEITTLDFPLEKKDKYYMTLFAEKFKEARREIKEKALTSLRMASN